MKPRRKAPLAEAPPYTPKVCFLGTASGRYWPIGVSRAENLRCSAGIRADQRRPRHGAIPIERPTRATTTKKPDQLTTSPLADITGSSSARSEEHTSELQSHVNLVCRLLLE